MAAECAERSLTRWGARSRIDALGERRLAGLTRSDNGDDAGVAQCHANPSLGMPCYELARSCRRSRHKVSSDPECSPV